VAEETLSMYIAPLKEKNKNYNNVYIIKFKNIQICINKTLTTTKKKYQKIITKINIKYTTKQQKK
jgi:hypothetical protein